MHKNLRLDAGWVYINRRLFTVRFGSRVLYMYMTHAEGIQRRSPQTKYTSTFAILYIHWILRSRMLTKPPGWKTTVWYRYKTAPLPSFGCSKPPPPFLLWMLRWSFELFITRALCCFKRRISRPNVQHFVADMHPYPAHIAANTGAGAGRAGPSGAPGAWGANIRSGATWATCRGPGDRYGHFF